VKQNESTNVEHYVRQLKKLTKLCNNKKA